MAFELKKNDSYAAANFPNERCTRKLIIEALTIAITEMVYDVAYEPWVVRFHLLYANDIVISTLTQNSQIYAAP